MVHYRKATISNLRVVNSIDTKGSATAVVSGAGLLGTGSPTYPRHYMWTDSGIIVHQYEVDITGLGCKGDAANDVIGLAAGGAAYLDQVTLATHGIIYRAEMTCLEVPGEGTATITADIDLGYDTLATLVYDGAADGAAIAAGAAWTLGKTVVSEDTATGFAANNYLYLTEGDTAATTGVYNAGKFVIRLYGMASLLKGLRYDTRNYGDIDYDEDTMVHYLNRALNILDARLIAFNSDQTLTTTVATLAKGYDYFTVPTGCLAVREVWIAQRRKQAVTMDNLYYRRQFKKNILEENDAIASGELIKTITQSTLDYTTIGAADNNADTYWVATGAGTLGSGDTVWRFDSQEPMFFTHIKGQIQWDAAASQAYLVTVIYDKATATVTAASNMPYNGTYDNAVREVLVQMLIHKKHKIDSPTDAVYAAIFDQVLTNDLVNRRYTRKQYRLDF
jgi:hypothetical protein